MDKVIVEELKRINTLLVFYFIVRYNKIARAMLVKMSGIIAKGPRPKALKPKTDCTNGLDEMA